MPFSYFIDNYPKYNSTLMNNHEVLDKEIKYPTTRLFKIIKVLIITGAVFGIHPWFIIISAPLYFLGVVILWVKVDLKRKVKLKWTLYPLLGVPCAWAIIFLVGFLIKYVFKINM